MNLPNRLTVVRILLVPVIVACMLINFPNHYVISGIFFAIASITDYFDGKIARQRNLVTTFGKFADPLADKILVISVLVCLVQLQLCSGILVIIVLFREFAVTSIRLVSANNGTVISANMAGKIKTVSQIIAVSAIFLLQYVLELMSLGLLPTFGGIELSTFQMIFDIIGRVLLWISALFTVSSGIIYLKESWKLIEY